jgi:hypothetical protein
MCTFINQSKELKVADISRLVIYNVKKVVEFYLCKLFAANYKIE